MHAALGTVGYYLLMSLAMGAVDSGMLEAPLWLKALAMTVSALLLPLALPVVQFAPVNWPTVSGLLCLFLVCLSNSLILAAVVRRVHVWARSRSTRRVGAATNDA